MKAKAFLLSLLLSNTIGIQAQIFKVNVTIDGPGVVDEYYIPSADGKKQVKLKAVPSKFLGNVSFDGWSGDATGTSEELTVDADKAQNIHATFTWHRPVKQYPKLNLKQSWADMGKPLYYEALPLWEPHTTRILRGYNYLPVDYNRDGYLDYVHFPMFGAMGRNDIRPNVRFWLGKVDGTFEEDPKNDDRMEGTVYSIFVKYADFNDDGWPDFCSFSSGYDRSGTKGDYPVILMSGPDGVYHDLRFTQWQKWELAEDETVIQKTSFHGGTVGDFDNDGDIDALFWNSDDGKGETCLYLENDGKGNFTEHKASDIIDISPLATTFPIEVIGELYPCYLDCELSDLNNDGYNDLLMTGGDAPAEWYIDPTLGHGYISPSIVLWGSSSGRFSAANATMMPVSRLGYGGSLAPVFYDLNGDGIKEILILKYSDGLFGTETFKSCYLQVLELEGNHYVDKTSQYIPVENEFFNNGPAQSRPFIENIDGIDYLCYGDDDEHYYPGLGVGTCKAYAIRGGILQPVEPVNTTRVSTFDEGLPIYVDGERFTDIRSCNDGVNPVDTISSHHWSEFVGDWDSSYSAGNMWRIDLHHREDTHAGRTCIRWNRDGLDPEKERDTQTVFFEFISDVDIQSLLDKDYYLEFYIKNSDPALTLNIGFETHDDDYNSDYFRGIEATVSSRQVESDQFNGEWQRMLIPLSAFHGDVGFTAFKSFYIKVGKGDLQNEFFIDDIRIRKVVNNGKDDYKRAFTQGYLGSEYQSMERMTQVNSQAFKAMLLPLIVKFAPDSMAYFNSHITDYDTPLNRGMATCMAYYTARCIGAETNNASNGEQPEDIWEGVYDNYDELLPHWQDPGEEDAPEEMFWRDIVFGGSMTAWYWNFCHVSDYSGINVIALDKEANSFHWNDPLTWEDAICAITRLYDSLDPNKNVVGDMNGDGVVNVADIVELINGDGDVNLKDIETIVNVIMAK